MKNGKISGLDRAREVCWLAAFRIMLFHFSDVELSGNKAQHMFGYGEMTTMMNNVNTVNTI